MTPKDYGFSEYALNSLTAVEDDAVQVCVHRCVE